MEDAASVAIKYGLQQRKYVMGELDVMQTVKAVVLTSQLSAEFALAQEEESI